jgi:hypothetical protein
MQNDTPTALGALQVDETKLKGHVDEVVRSSVEETLNAAQPKDLPPHRSLA